ncbi:hypothetical protein FHR22_001886 [Sphingopyxis panaciterrae]|uniref:DUF6339 family protein n=1 Tax=Sphingopyxis panaciterrae TaxID=363841 RepID=UPI0014202F8B|nr:DUF6339 family protein [Sphingopyxis panaciterrae]NIJ37202.1 hypothetical protein [Sphingopyxis panaciterrae]
MKARLLKSTALEQLRASIAVNLETYRNGNFEYLEADPSFSFDHHVEIELDALGSLKAPSGNSFYEVENCEIVYSALQSLSPYDARDERFWAYLSHTILLDHARRRWPIPDDTGAAVTHIAKHWFARDKRQVERDQVGSRLWWMGHLCARIDNVDRDLALRAFLFRSDVRANLVERPTVSQSVNLFGAIIKRLISSFNGKQQLFERNAFRQLMMEINSVGGYRLLDCLGQPEIDRLLDRIIAERLQLAEL